MTPISRAAAAVALIVCACSVAPAANAGSARPAAPRLASRLDALARRASTRDVVVDDAGPGAVLRNRGRLVVDARLAAIDDGALQALADAGASVVAVDSTSRTVTLEVADDDLTAIGSLPGVENVSEVLVPAVHGAGDATFAAACNPVVSAGDAILRADLARSTFGVDGSGVTVGVLSDSFNRSSAQVKLADDIASGDLPGAGNPCGRTSVVSLVDDSTTGADEGRAMAQIVHDLAPGARLAFASAFGSASQFAANIRALATAGADVIVDDVTYFDEPFYQDGPIAVAVRDVVAGGVTYVSSAGNTKITIGGNPAGSYEAAAYRPAPCPSGVVALDCHDFVPGAGVDVGDDLTVASGRRITIDVQWAEPRAGVVTDLDAYLVSASSGAVLARSQDVNIGVTGTQKPFELLVWTNTSASASNVRLVVARRAGAGAPRWKAVLFTSSGGLVAAQHATGAFAPDVVGPTIFGHNGATGAVTVAAAAPGARAVEPYSAMGPVTLLFGPVSGSLPAAPLRRPQTVRKPDVTATDCVSTTFFSGASKVFCGTSAAAPHVAAVAALVAEARGAATGRPPVASVLVSSAAPFPGPRAVSGVGIVDAVAAVQTG